MKGAIKAMSLVGPGTIHARLTQLATSDAAIGEWISPPLRRLVLYLAADEALMAERICNAIGEQIPEYKSSDIAERRSDIYQHCLLATRGWYQCLFLGCSPSADDLAAMASMGAQKCRLGVSLGALLQAFRVGSILYWEELVAAGQKDRAVTDELFSKVSRFLLHHIDQISEAVSRGYYEEQARLCRGRHRLTIQRAKTSWRLVEPLTHRELIVLRLLESGRSNKEIAGEMCVCENTVKFHLKNIYSKLGARRRTDAIARAQSLGLEVGQGQV